MANYRLSKLADEDIQKIAATTLTAWGFAQALTYMETLHKTMTMLAANSSLGKLREELFIEAMSFPVGKHKPAEGQIQLLNIC